MADDGLYKLFEEDWISFKSKAGRLYQGVGKAMDKQPEVVQDFYKYAAFGVAAKAGNQLFKKVFGERTFSRLDHSRFDPMVGGKILGHLAKDKEIVHIAKNKWGIGKHRTNQLFEHTFTKAYGDDIARLSGIEKRMGLEPGSLDVIRTSKKPK